MSETICDIIRDYESNSKINIYVFILCIHQDKVLVGLINDIGCFKYEINIKNKRYFINNNTVNEIKEYIKKILNKNIKFSNTHYDKRFPQKELIKINNYYATAFLLNDTEFNKSPFKNSKKFIKLNNNNNINNKFYEIIEKYEEKSKTFIN